MFAYIVYFVVRTYLLVVIGLFIILNLLYFSKLISKEYTFKDYVRKFLYSFLTPFMILTKSGLNKLKP